MFISTGRIYGLDPASFSTQSHSIPILPTPPVRHGFCPCLSHEPQHSLSPWSFGTALLPFLPAEKVVGYNIISLRKIKFGRGGILGYNILIELSREAQALERNVALTHMGANEISNKELVDDRDGTD